MKKFIFSFSLIFMLVLSFVTVSYAYDVIIFNNNAANYMAVQMFLQKTRHVVLDVRPSVSAFTDKVEISYDDLSSICTNANSIGLSCSLYYNSSAKVYIIDVDDKALMGVTSLKGVMGNADGKVYTAKKPEQNIHVDITTPTNPDYTDTLLNITEALENIPIIAQLNVLIADNQLLVMDYIKLAIESIWDLDDSLDDRIDTLSSSLNNRLAYIGSRVASIDSQLVDVTARVTDISGQLDSVIVDDKLQVNTSPIESRLDRLIGLYSEVNSVSFDTVDIGYGITDAVGGELKDVVFWGYSDGTSVGSGIRYTLDGVVYHPEVTLPNGGTFVLRSIKLGTSIPDDISSNPALMEGVWQSGRNYYLSDTYAIGTGIYSQRIDVDASGNWVAASSVFYETLRKWSISVPAGDTSIFAGYALRITGKYDKVGGVTKTADIITAINNINIPAFDDSRVIAAINNIPAYDDSGLVAAVTTVSDQITEHFGQYDAPYVFPNLIHNKTSSKYINGVSSSAFADVPANSRLLYSTSSGIYSGGKSGTTGTPGATGSASWTIKPTYSTASGFGYSFGYSRNMGTLNTGSSAVVYSMSQTVSFNDFGGASRSFKLSFNARHHPRTYSATASLTIYPRWDDSGAWLGWYNGSTLLSDTGEPSRRLLTAPPEAGSYYIYGTTDSGIDVVYASRFTGFLQSQSDRVVNAIGSISQPIDYTTQLTAVADKLDTLINQSSDTVVNVVTNNTYITNVYQLDDENDVADRSKEGIEKIGGVFKWLWKHAFKDAFGAADVTKLDGLL